MDEKKPTYSEMVLQLLTEIRDELRKLNEKQPRQRTRRESVLAGELPVIAQIWNEWADPFFPKVESMSTASVRYKQAQERWEETVKKHHGIEENTRAYWVGVIQRVNKSAFCKGANDRKWIASIDFLVRPDSAAKVLEGKYDGKEAALKKKEPKFEFDPAANAWREIR